MSWLDDLLGKAIKFSGQVLPQRKTLNIIGSASVSVADNPGTGETDLTIDPGVPANNTITAAMLQSDSVTTVKITDDAVTDAKLRNSAGLSVIGRSANSTGSPADIVGTDGLLLRVSGTTLGFGQALTAAIANNAVTLAKLATQEALSVLANATNSTDVPTAVAAATDGHIFRRAGTALGFGKILTSMITGTATNNNATAGDIGEYVEARVLVGSATTLVSGTAKTVTSISLTAGDWDVNGLIGFNPPTTLAYEITSISLVNNTRTTLGESNEVVLTTTAVGTGNSIAVPPVRFSLSATTTIYLVAVASFTGSCTAYGFIRARRAR